MLQSRFTAVMVPNATLGGQRIPSGGQKLLKSVKDKEGISNIMPLGTKIQRILALLDWKVAKKYPETSGLKDKPCV